MEGIEPGQEVKGTLAIKATAEAAPAGPVGSFELFIDGRLVARFSPGSALQLNTSKLADGYHELRVVAVSANKIENRGRIILPVIINNHSQKVELSVSPPNGAAATDKLKISARQTGATAITIRQNGREVGRIKGDSGQIDVLAAILAEGRWPSRHRAKDRYLPCRRRCSSKSTE